MSDLVGNPEDRFSRVTAHIKQEEVNTSTGTSHLRMNYENLSIQDTENFFQQKKKNNENFNGKFLIFSIFLLKTLIVGKR